MMEKVRAAVFDMLLNLSGNMARLPQGSRWLDLFAGMIFSTLIQPRVLLSLSPHCPSPQAAPLQLKQMWIVRHEQLSPSCDTPSCVTVDRVAIIISRSIKTG